MELARREAERFNHNFVGTEHVLLGIIRAGEGTASRILQQMGLDLPTIRMEVEKLAGTGPDQKFIGNIPYTPRTKKVLLFAWKEAQALGHPHVGTEHILLGLLLEGDGLAARVLKNQDVDLETTRRLIVERFAPSNRVEMVSSEKKTVPSPWLVPFLMHRAPLSPDPDAEEEPVATVCIPLELAAVIAEANLGGVVDENILRDRLNGREAQRKGKDVEWHKDGNG